MRYLFAYIKILELWTGKQRYPIPHSDLQT